MTTETKGEARLVISGGRQGRYGFTYADAIIEDAKGNFIYIRQGWGGEGTVDGECYRWRHGYATAVKSHTTLEEARELFPAASHIGNDLPWAGEIIERYADELGI